MIIKGKFGGVLLSLSVGKGVESGGVKGDSVEGEGKGCTGIWVEVVGRAGCSVSRKCTLSMDFCFTSVESAKTVKVSLACVIDTAGFRVEVQSHERRSYLNCV